MVAISFQRRFVASICVGLDIAIPFAKGIRIAAGLPFRPKRHTIRVYGKRPHPRPGDTLQLYCAQRSPTGFKIDDARCSRVQRIMIWPNDMIVMLDGKLLTARQIQRLARDDGFSNVNDMQAFMLKEHRGVEKLAGSLIHWESI